jgi:hypothetical protein
MNIYASALKDNEIEVNELPMPRVLGEGEEEPREVWRSGRGIYNPWPQPSKTPSKGTYLYCFDSEEAARVSNRLNKVRGKPWPATLDSLLQQAASRGCTYLCLVDSSYTVIETWRVS